MLHSDYCYVATDHESVYWRGNQVFRFSEAMIQVIGMGSAGKRLAGIGEAIGHMVSAYDIIGDWPKPRWDVDAVFIATPPDSHLAWAKESILRGIPTFIEKPLGLPSEIYQWQELLEKAEAPVAVGYQLRYHEQYKRLMSSMPEYGDDWLAAWLVYSHDLRKWRPEQDYRTGYICRKRESGGGIIMDASHELDIANWLFGLPQKVTVKTNYGEIDGMHAETTADITLAYTDLINWRECKVHLDGVMPEKRRGALIVYQDGWETADGRDAQEMGRAYHSQVEHFLAGRTPISSGWTALETLRLIGMCHKAGE